MSYILDALRRADSERERGAVPGVHAQPVPLGSAEAKVVPPSRLWVGVSLALAAVLVAMLAWLWAGHDAAAPEAAEATRVPPPPLPVTPPHPPVAEAPPPAPAVQAAPVQTAPAAQAVAAVRKPVPSTVKPAASAAPRAGGAAASATNNGSAAALAASRLPTASELPEDIQRGLPTLAIGGASYSQNAESRMLIVNGQVLREGDRVAPEVTLEEIRLKEAVLSTKGRRYRIVY